MTAPPPGQAPTDGRGGPSRTPGPAEQARRSRPAVPGAPVVKKTERPHPLTPLIRGWLVFLAFIVYLVRDLVPDGEDDGFERR